MVVDWSGVEAAVADELDCEAGQNDDPAPASVGRDDFVEEVGVVVSIRHCREAVLALPQSKD